MVEGFSIINYKGKNIIYANYSSLGKDKEKILNLVNTLAEEYLKNPPNSVLGLTNVTNIHFDMDILNAFKSLGKKTAPHEKKIALVGVNGLLKAGYNFVVGFNNSNKFRAFDTEEEAKEWLVKD